MNSVSVDLAGFGVTGADEHGVCVVVGSDVSGFSSRDGPTVVGSDVSGQGVCVGATVVDTVFGHGVVGVVDGK